MVRAGGPRHAVAMVTALFVLAICSFALMGLFVWLLARHHRRAEHARQDQERASEAPVPPAEPLK